MNYKDIKKFAEGDFANVVINAGETVGLEYDGQSLEFSNKHLIIEMVYDGYPEANEAKIIFGENELNYIMASFPKSKKTATQAALLEIAKACEAIKPYDHEFITAEYGWGEGMREVVTEKYQEVADKCRALARKPQEKFLLELIKHNSKHPMLTRNWKVISKSVSEEFVNAVKCIIKNAEEKYSIHICGPDGTGEPIITSTVIAFNGDKSLWQDYDTFSLFDEEGNCQIDDSCRNSYGIVVYAVLLLAERYGYVQNLGADDATDADSKAYYLMLLAGKETEHLPEMQGESCVNYPFSYGLSRERKWHEACLKMINELENE